MGAGLGNGREMVYCRGHAAAHKLGEVPRVAQHQMRGIYVLVCMLLHVAGFPRLHHRLLTLCPAP